VSAQWFETDRADHAAQRSDGSALLLGMPQLNTTRCGGSTVM